MRSRVLDSDRDVHREPAETVNEQLEPVEPGDEVALEGDVGRRHDRPLHRHRAAISQGGVDLASASSGQRHIGVPRDSNDPAAAADVEANDVKTVSSGPVDRLTRPGIRTDHQNPARSAECRRGHPDRGPPATDNLPLGRRDRQGDVFARGDHSDRHALPPRDSTGDDDRAGCLDRFALAQDLGSRGRRPDPAPVVQRLDDRRERGRHPLSLEGLRLRDGGRGRDGHRRCDHLGHLGRRGRRRTCSQRQGTGQKG